MKVDDLIDLLSANRKALNENFEVLLLDPRKDVGVQQSEWTGNFLPVPQNYTHTNGRTETVCLMLPHPEHARLVNEAGELVPYSQNSPLLRETTGG